MSSLLFSSTSFGSIIPAAIIRRHTVSYKDVPVDQSKPIHHPVIYVPSSMVNLFVHFKTKSSQVHLRQVHKGQVGHVQHTISQDEPHYLKHEIQKPVIQTIREVIIPYRQVIQEIKPVVEEVKTVVATGTPKSSVYMNFGQQSQQYSNPSTNGYNSYGYVLNTNHESATPYQSDVNPTNNYNSVDSPTITQNKDSTYDLSSIYGIKPTVDQISHYLMPSSEQSVSKDKIENSYDLNPSLYFTQTSHLQQNNGISPDFGYNLNSVNEKSVAYDLQNSGYLNDYNIQDYGQKEINYQDNNLEKYTYGNLAQNVEPQYYINYLDSKNSGNTNQYYSEANQEYGSQPQQESSAYIQNVVNPGYYDQYSGDLATSDGSSLRSPSAVPLLFDAFSSEPVTKSTTLSSLARLVSQYSYQ